MRENLWTLIFIGIGIICLGAAIAEDQVQIALDFIKELSKGAAAGIPRP
ncbi:MAG: hypothetical protein ACFFGZ_11935 [Candidatus Thorarchaeota archaeon]